MEAISLPIADRRASPAAEPGIAERISAPHPVGDANTISFAHFFYERSAGNDLRLAPYIAFPIAVAASLGMWAAIVDLVLRR